MGITIADNFNYQGAKPLDARIKYATVALMKAQVEATLYDGCIAYVDEDEKMYQFKSSNTVDATTGKWREFTTGGSGGGHTIEDEEGTELTQRDTLQFGEGFKVTDDSTNEKTKVDLDKLATGELDDIFDDLPPTVEPAYHKYSTIEHKVGTWIDGRPIYEKVITGSVVVGSWISLGVSEEIDNVYIQGIMKDANNTSIVLPYANGEYTLSVLANTSGHNGQFEFLGNSSYSTGHTYILNVRYTKVTDII